MHCLALASGDWIVMALYMTVVIGVGLWANRRQKTSEDYFLGGRRLRWWVVGISLMATSFSSVSLIGGTGFGFETGMQWFQLQIGDLLALLLVCAIFIPFFCRLRLTTAYEYLEARFGVTARLIGSGLFLGQTLLRASVLVYGPALALSAVLGWDVTTAIVVSAAAAILYSSFGGISAVVWTDLIQFCVILFAVGYCLFVVAGDVPGGLSAAVEHARGAGRLQAVTVSADPSTPYNLLGSLVPYAVLAFSLFGTGQQAVQRFLSVKDVRAARRAAIAGWAAGTIALGVTLFLGACLAAWAELAPGAEKVLPKDIAGNDVLPLFLSGRLGGGVAGLMLAAIFAASMSSMDSAIHSMSTCTIVDFRRRLSESKPDPKAELRIARITTAVIGVLATLGAVAAAGEETTLLETLVKWLGYFAGPLLGMFLLGMLTRRTNEFGAVVGALFSFAAVLEIVLIVDGRIGSFHPLWLALFSCATTVVIGLVASLPGPAPEAEQTAGLTWRERA